MLQKRLPKYHGCVVCCQLPFNNSMQVFVSTESAQVVVYATLLLCEEINM